MNIEYLLNEYGFQFVLLIMWFDIPYVIIPSIFNSS